LIEPVLYVFGGLPGVGKSTLARSLAEKTGSMYLRIDTIEQNLRSAGVEVSGPEGYLVSYAIARENLSCGLSVVADSVNPVAITRKAWRAVAADAGAQCVEIEVVCSDTDEHQRRVESRISDIDGLVLPTWQQVIQRDYEPSTANLKIDTAGRSIAESLDMLFTMLKKGEW
jgi:predicted kinase